MFEEALRRLRAYFHGTPAVSGPAEHHRQIVAAVLGIEVPKPNPFDRDQFLRDVMYEYARVSEKHGPYYASAHEGFAVMYEELDELWEEVRKKSKNRDLANMREECVQIASCALKFALSFGEKKEETV